MKTVRIWFQKKGAARYISHLDLTHCMARAIHRAKIPSAAGLPSFCRAFCLEYTQPQ